MQPTSRPTPTCANFEWPNCVHDVRQEDEVDPLGAASPRFELMTYRCIGCEHTESFLMQI